MTSFGVLRVHPYIFPRPIPYASGSPSGMYVRYTFYRQVKQPGKIKIARNSLFVHKLTCMIDIQRHLNK